MVFTKTGQTTRNCLRSFAVEGAITPDAAVLGIDHSEEMLHQEATITLLNLASDGSARLNWNLSGYQCDIYYGLKVAGTPTYYQCAPLWVKDDVFYSGPGRLTMTLRAIGLTDRLDRDRASADFYNTALLAGDVVNPHNTATVQTLINALCTVNGVQTGVSKVFNRCADVVADWGTLDSLMGTFVPKDSFSVLQGESRLQVILRLLQMTSMVFRIENDGHLNFFVPVNSGSTYDYTYQLQATPRPHQFFQRNRRNATGVQPNYVVVTSRLKDLTTEVTGDIQAPGFALGVSQIVVENISSGGAIIAGSTFTIAGHTKAYLVTSHVQVVGGVATIQCTPALTAAANTGDDVKLTPGYWGSDEDTTSKNLEEKDLYERLPVTTNSEASDIAGAILDWFQLHNPKGALVAPQNAGQEIYDYVTVLDERETPPLDANVGRIRRHWGPKGQSTIQLTFGNDHLMSYRYVREAGEDEEPDYKVVAEAQNKRIAELEAGRAEDASDRALMATILREIVVNQRELPKLGNIGLPGGPDWGVE